MQEEHGTLISCLWQKTRQDKRENDNDGGACIQKGGIGILRNCLAGSSKTAFVWDLVAKKQSKGSCWHLVSTKEKARTFVDDDSCWDADKTTGAKNHGARLSRTSVGCARTPLVSCVRPQVFVSLHRRNLLTRLQRRTLDKKIGWLLFLDMFTIKTQAPMSVPKCVLLLGILSWHQQLPGKELICLFLQNVAKLTFGCCNRIVKTLQFCQDHAALWK